MQAPQERPLAVAMARLARLLSARLVERLQALGPAVALQVAQLLEPPGQVRRELVGWQVWLRLVAWLRVLVLL